MDFLDDERHQLYWITEDRLPVARPRSCGKQDATGHDQERGERKIARWSRGCQDGGRKLMVMILISRAIASRDRRTEGGIDAASRPQYPDRISHG
jgi:hypothetical protein